MVSIADAQRRAVVRLPDGRTGRLIYWPAPNHRPNGTGRVGALARIQLPSGAVISAHPDTIQLTEGTVMTTVPARIDEMRIHSEHLALLDDIERAKAEGDYTALEHTRRWLKWILTELGTLYDACEQAVIQTLPAEGAVVDGVNTVAKAGTVTRKFDNDKIIRRLADDYHEDPPGFMAALLRVYPMDRPRITALTDLDIFWKDYVTQETTGRARVITEGQVS